MRGSKSRHSSPGCGALRAPLPLAVAPLRPQSPSDVAMPQLQTAQVHASDSEPEQLQTAWQRACAALPPMTLRRPRSPCPRCRARRRCPARALDGAAATPQHTFQRPQLGRRRSQTTAEHGGGKAVRKAPVRHEASGGSPQSGSSSAASPHVSSFLETLVTSPVTCHWASWAGSSPAFVAGRQSKISKMTRARGPDDRRSCVQARAGRTPASRLGCLEQRWGLKLSAPAQCSAEGVRTAPHGQFKLSGNIRKRPFQNSKKNSDKIRAKKRPSSTRRT